MNRRKYLTPVTDIIGEAPEIRVNQIKWFYCSSLNLQKVTCDSLQVDKNDKTEQEYKLLRQIVN